MEKIFKISTIIPVYNTEKYLAETVESVLRQSIGFEDNIQLILVNDCSTDNSDILCEEFCTQYPENMKYIKLEQNSGVSVARNTGLKYATGKYVNFLDSDDMWSDNAYQRMIDFMEEHCNEIDMVSSNVWYFEAREGSHPLNQSSVEDKIIDIDQEYKSIRSLGSNCLVKRDVAEKFPFNEKQKCWEDSAFINTVILNKKKYGMLTEDVKFYYRVRKDQSSASNQLYGKTKRYYLEDLTLLFDGIYEQSMKYCGYFAPMCQYFIMNAVQVRFQEKNIEAVLNEEERKEYDKILIEILNRIDDKYIKEIVYADELTRKVMLAYKYGIDLRDDISNIIRDRDSSYCKWNRTKENSKLLSRWMKAIHHGKKLDMFFKEKKYKKLAIYGVSDIGELLIEEMKDTEIDLCYGIDRNADQILAEIPLYKPTDELPAVDAIVVTAVYFFEDICQTLRRNGVACPIISLNDVLDDIE